MYITKVRLRSQSSKNIGNKFHLPWLNKRLFNSLKRKFEQRKNRTRYYWTYYKAWTCTGMLYCASEGKKEVHANHKVPLYVF